MEFFSSERSNTESLRQDAKQQNGRWTKEEHQRFVEAIKIYGKSWKKVEEFVGTRSGAQIRSHAQKFFLRLEKELKTKQTEQKGNKNKTLLQSLRKFSEASISTHQDENNSDYEKPEDQLRENLSLHESKSLENSKSEEDILPITAEGSLKDANVKKNIKNTQENRSKAVLEEKKTECAKPLNSDLLSKLSPSDGASNELISLVKSLLLLNESNYSTETTTSIKTPIPKKAYPHQSVYCDLMNYFSKFNKTAKNLKLSDFVDFPGHKTLDDADSYEFPPSEKKLKQL